MPASNRSSARLEARISPELHALIKRGSPAAGAHHDRLFDDSRKRLPRYLTVRAVRMARLGK